MEASPILLGKSRSEILKEYGQPELAGGLAPPLGGSALIDMTWTYKGEFGDFLEIKFDNNTNKWVERVIYQNLPEGMLVQDLLPRELMKKPPDWRAVWGESV